MIKMNAAQLRNFKSERDKKNQKDEKDQIQRKPIYIILDNVLDTYNIGSIFRLADAVLASKVIITGQAEVPPNTRIKKASINTTEIVPWEYKTSAEEAIREIREIGGIRVVGVEQAQGSIPYTKAKYKYPLAVVVGNESNGISKEALELCDQIVELPMFGINISLNVMVSLGIVLYKAIEQNDKTL